MKKQNITLSIPKDILREAKHLAMDRGISLSVFLVEALEECVKHLSQMRRAAERQTTLMRSGLKLSTKGKIRWTREHLHAPAEFVDTTFLSTLTIGQPRTSLIVRKN